MKSWGPCFCMLDAIDELISHWTGIHKPDKRDIKNKQFAPFVFYNISLSSAWQFLSQGMNLEVIHAISKDTITINVDTKWEKQAARIQNKWLCPLRILSTPKCHLICLGGRHRRIISTRKCLVICLQGRHLIMFTKLCLKFYGHVSVCKHY